MAGLDEILAVRREPLQEKAKTFENGSVLHLFRVLQEQRILYRQENSDRIDFPALGDALRSLNLGTVDLKRLSNRNGETDFLTDLIQKEIRGEDHPDALIFAGPKALLDDNVSRESPRVNCTGGEPSNGSFQISLTYFAPSRSSRSTATANPVPSGEAAIEVTRRSLMWS